MRVPTVVIRKLSWTPVRRGATYCAPACGRGCTWDQYQRAMRAAAMMVRALGRGWRPRVWENLGWHHAAYAPGRGLEFEVSPTLTGKYWARLQAGRCFEGYGRTPRSAVRGAIREARRHVAAVARLLANVSSVSSPR